MEEDIKILEDYAYAMCTISSTTEKDQRIAQAIENLIKGYKELEKENLKLHTEIANEVYWASSPTKQIEENYILKQKVKEFLEKSKLVTDEKKEKTYFLIDVTELRQELLEERN